MILEPVNLDQLLLQLFFYAMSYTKSREKQLQTKQNFEFLPQKAPDRVALTYSNTLHGEKPYRGYLCIKYH